MNNTVSWSLSIKTFFKITQQISFVIIDYPSLAEIMIIKNIGRILKVAFKVIQINGT